MTRMIAALLVGAALTAGCGGSSNPAPAAPAATPAPTTTALAPSGRFVANGSKGVTFTFALGPGVPPGEFVVVRGLPAAAPCHTFSCPVVFTPLDGFSFSVGPQPLSLSTFASVALTGVSSPFALSPLLMDATSDSAPMPNFGFLNPTGGPIVVADSPSGRPVPTLVPGDVYVFMIFDTTVPPT